MKSDECAGSTNLDHWSSLPARMFSVLVLRRELREAGLDGTVAGEGEVLGAVEQRALDDGTQGVRCHPHGRGIGVEAVAGGGVGDDERERVAVSAAGGVRRNVQMELSVRGLVEGGAEFFGDDRDDVGVYDRVAAQHLSVESVRIDEALRVDEDTVAGVVAAGSLEPEIADAGVHRDGLRSARDEVLLLRGQQVPVALAEQLVALDGSGCDSGCDGGAEHGLLGHVHSSELVGVPDWLSVFEGQMQTANQA